MPVIRILLGIILLVLGRKLFWFFVAAVGFVVGASLAPQFFPGQPDWVILLIALLVGLLGAGLAVFLQGLAVGLAGFLAGGYFATSLLQMLGRGDGGFSWLPFVIGGVLGAVLVAVLFDWALIILSSVTGAGLIVQSLHGNPTFTTLVFLALLVIGIVIQANTMRREPAVPAKQGTS